MARCHQCGWPLPEQALYCPSCGIGVSQGSQENLAGPASSSPLDDAGPSGRSFPQDTEPASDKPLPIPENVAGVVAYLTIVPAIVFLLLEPFKRNRFVRFHSLQHLLLWAAGVGIGLAAGVAGAILQLIPFMRVLVFPLAGLISLAWFFLWLLLVVKAYHHELFKLPILGDLAEEWM